MTKRIFALILCFVLCISVFVGCSGKIDPKSEYKGQQAIMYLTENIYNLDPAYAYTNDATRSVVGMLFDTLFTIDNNGKVQESLAKSYKTEEKVDDGVTEYYMYIEINDLAFWSDGVPVTADNVVYAWKRLLNPNNSFDAAALLFDIKNARAYNRADSGKDDVGLYADDKLLTIQFEEKIDYDQFLLNLTSLALAPLREDIVSKNADWSKKPGTAAYSGPFKLSRTSYSVNGDILYDDLYYSLKLKDKDNKDIYVNATETGSFKEQVLNSFILERNMYYYRNAEKDDKLDKSVTPYRILVDCSLSDEDIKAGWEAGAILYVGDIPMSLRSTYKDSATVKDSLSTTSAYFNQNIDIVKGGFDENGNPVSTEKLFADPIVRQALSLAIDRESIADALVFADVATGIVPTGVADASNIKNTFRENGKNDFEFLSEDVKRAENMLNDAGIIPSEYTFSISVAAYDEDLIFVAEQICEAWSALGFNVSVKKIGTVANNDFHKDVYAIPSDMCDDLYDEAFRRGEFDVAIIDLVAPSVDPFSVLAPFALGFSGQAMDMSSVDNYSLNPHITGYNSNEYNSIIENIYAQKTISSRNAELHLAEEILMRDMPVAPIVFNKSAYLLNDDTLDLNNKVLLWDKSSNYYMTLSFQKMSLSDKNYNKYLETCARFVADNFEKWQQNPLSYFGSAAYKDSSLAEFAQDASNYSYLFKDKDYDFVPELTTGGKTEQTTESTTETK